MTNIFVYSDLLSCSTDVTDLLQEMVLLDCAHLNIHPSAAFVQIKGIRVGGVYFKTCLICFSNGTKERSSRWQVSYSEQPEILQHISTFKRSIFASVDISNRVHHTTSSSECIHHG